jgi:hypothetical protein
MEKKLRLPTALAVVVLAGCGDDASPPDSGRADAAVVDSGAPRDTGTADASDACPPFTEWDPDTMMCLPLV